MHVCSVLLTVVKVVVAAGVGVGGICTCVEKEGPGSPGTPDKGNNRCNKANVYTHLKTQEFL